MAVLIRLNLVLLVTLCLLGFYPSESMADFYSCTRRPAIFVFGDSLFDSGNSNYFETTPNFQGNYPPYGQTYFRYPTGRTTDGRIIPDFIAELGGIPLITPYLHPGNKDYTYGANFASGGAGVLIETLPGLVINLHNQLTNFMKVANELRKENTAKKVKEVLSDAVYLFAVGSNDYVTPFLQKSPFLNSFTPEDYVSMVVGNYTDILNQIIDKGGKKFGFLNLGDLGCIPLARAHNNGSCITQLSHFASLHNSAFAESVSELDKNTNKPNQYRHFHYALLNYKAALNERMNSPTKYGFEEGKIACCGTGPYRGINSCGGKKETKHYELCSNPSEHVFFDAGHLTDAVYAQLADMLWSGHTNVVGPNNIQKFYEGYDNQTPP